MHCETQEFDTDATGTLGVRCLRRFWRRQLEILAQPQRQERLPVDTRLESILMDGLGAGIVDSNRFIFQTRPSFEQFEQWIVEHVGGSLRPEVVERVNRAVTDVLEGPRHDYPIRAEIADPVFSADDMAFWEENGYVVLRAAVSADDARAAERAVWAFLGKDPSRPETWYDGDHSFWASLVHHPVLDRNRESKRIHKAFAQLWGTENLLTAIDRTSLNLPVRADDIDRSGPSRLHWDTSIAQPMGFGMQGILYLNDVAADQGAFQCVPGFHRRMGEWLQGLDPGEDPRAAARELEAVPIAAGAGDLIIWRHDLPHGSSRNLARFPRAAQYIHLYPPDYPINSTWA